MSKTLAEKKDLIQILRWSSAVKIVFCLALAAILAVLSLTHTLTFDARSVIFIFLPFLVIVNAVLLFLARKDIGWSGYLIYPEILLNIIVVTSIIRISGDEHAIFLFLYLMPAFTASLVSLRTLNVTFALSIVGYGIEHYLTMTPGSGFSAFAAEVLNGEELSDFFLLGLIIAAIGFQARYYLKRIKEANEKLMKLKDEFMFRTVHDLRGPASTARFIVEKYENYDFSKNHSAEIQKDMKTIRELNEGVLAMVEDLLQVAKGEQVDVHLSVESVDLKEMIAAVLSEFEREISQKGIKLDYIPGEAPLILADRLRLREVFVNLIENAVKYNRKGGQLTVTHDTKESSLTTSIENTSIDPLTRDDLEKFFKPYAQIGQNEDPGNGLGLYIVKKLVEKMGGEVSVTLDSGKNSVTFHVSLPIAANQ